MWEGLLPFSHLSRAVFPLRGRDPLGTLAILLATIGIVIAAVALAIGVAVPAVSGPFDAPDEAAGGDGPPQVNPGEVGSGGVGVAEERLFNDVARQVQAGAINLTQEDYDQAREQFGDEQVDGLIEEYRNRAGDGERPELLYRSQLALENHTDRVAAYWELYALYEEVTDTEAGRLHPATVRSPSGVQYSPDRETSHKIAMELDERADRVEETAAETLRQYRALAAESDRDYASTIDAIEASRENITTTHRAVLREQFVATNLTLRAPETVRLSPLAPLEARGRLVAEDGTPVATERVILEFDPEAPAGTNSLAPGTGGRNGTALPRPGTQYGQALTNETGWFYLEYRPTTMPLNATALTVTASPADTRLVGDETTLAVRAEQIRPTLRVDSPASAVAFNETVTITGSLSSEGVQFENVPYRVFLNGQFVAENVTTTAGKLDTELQLPATVDPADARLKVQLRTDGQVLAPVNASAPLEVQTTPTALSLDAQSAGDGTVRVTGQLTSSGGARIVEQPVSVQLGDRTVAVVRTDERGSFDRIVAVPEGTVDTDDAVTVPVAVSFDGSGTNLATATERAQVTVPPSGSILGSWAQSLWANAEVIVFSAGILLLGGAGYLLSRRWRQSSETGAGRSPPTVSATDSGETDTLEPASLHSRTVEHWEAGRRAAAVRTGYAAVRLLLDEGATERLTHWEFYDHHRGRLDGEADTLLRRITEHYERVEFAAESVDESMVADVVAALRAFGSDLSEEELAGDLPGDRDGPSVSDD